MIEIKNLLLRFNNILFSESLKKSAIINILYQTIGIKINSKDIKIKNDIIYLDIKPIYKNEIFLKKDEFFLKLKEKLGEKSPQKII